MGESLLAKSARRSALMLCPFTQKGIG